MANQTGGLKNDDKTTDVQLVLERVSAMLDAGKPKEALAAIRSSRTASPWLMNAAAVCEMRQGNAEGAVQILRSLTVGSGGLVIRSDAPTVFKVNFAIALWRNGNLGGCQSTLAEIRDSEHPAVKELRNAIAKWKRSLSFWQRVSLLLGGEPSAALPTDAPFGHL